MGKMGLLEPVDVATQPPEPSVSAKEPATTSINGHEGQHPDLSKMCVIDCDTIQRIVPNTKPVPIDNECFTGHVFLMIRTPDVDNASDPAVLDDTPRQVSQYLSGKKRHFEFQFQVKLKEVPTGPLFLSCEVEQPIKLKRFTKGLANVLFAMIRKINSGFHYSLGDHADNPKKGISIEDERYEKTHLSFPVEASMDRIVITKSGDVPPSLPAYDLTETDANRQRRRRLGPGAVQWNLEDTYTLCLWSAYFDWLTWRSLNVKGVRPFSLSNFTGHQPVYLSVYEFRNMTHEEYKKKKPPHHRKDLTVYSRLEFTNCTKTEGGLADITGAFEKQHMNGLVPTESDSDLGSEYCIDESQHSNCSDVSGKSDPNAISDLSEHSGK